MTDVFERYPQAARAFAENIEGFPSAFRFVGAERACRRLPHRIAELIDLHIIGTQDQKEAMMVGAFFALGGGVRGSEIAPRYSPAAGIVLDLMHTFPDTPTPHRVAAEIDAAIKVTMLEEVEKFTRSFSGIFAGVSIFQGEEMRSLRHRLFADEEKTRLSLADSPIGDLLKSKRHQVMALFGHEKGAVSVVSFPRPDMN